MQNLFLFAVLKVKVDITCAEVVVAVRLFALTDQAIWVDHFAITVNLFLNINLPIVKAETYN